MLSVIKNKTFWMSLLIGLLGFCSSILLSISDLFRYDWSVVKNVIDTNGSLLMARLISSGVYAFLFSFFSYLIGKKLYKNYQIEQKKITKESKKELILMGIICVIFPFILYLMDIYLYYPNITEFVSIKFNLYNLLTTALYNGIMEELWFRYGLMSLFIFAFYKVLGKNNEKVDKKIVLMGVIFTSLLLFAFQLNEVIVLSSFSFIVLIRAILNYLVMNLIYSYFCVNYGLKYSIIIHILFIVFYVGVYPFVFSIL